MTTPMYRDIADQLRLAHRVREFRRGRGGQGSCRPSRNLQKHYGASRNTIRDAIKQLITLGLVETRPGQGTFVVPPVDPFVTTLTGDPNEGGGGGEGTSYASEVEKADRSHTSARSRSRSRQPRTRWPPACGYRSAPRSSAGTANGTSMEKPGPRRRPLPRRVRRPRR